MQFISAPLVGSFLAPFEPVYVKTKMYKNGAVLLDYQPDTKEMSNILFRITMENMKTLLITGINHGMMPTTSQPTAVHAVLAFIIILEALTFFFFGFLHSGVRLSLGFAVLQEPRIIPAMIVESLCGFLLSGSAFAVATRKSWSWPVSVIAHAFSIGGVLLGMAALALGAGPRTELNDIYHHTILIPLVIILIYLFTPVGKAVLGRA